MRPRLYERNRALALWRGSRANIKTVYCFPLSPVALYLFAGGRCFVCRFNVNATVNNGFSDRSMALEQKGNGCLENHYSLRPLPKHKLSGLSIYPKAQTGMTSDRRKVQWWSVYRKGSADRHYSDMYVKAGSIVPLDPAICR